MRDFAAKTELPVVRVLEQQAALLPEALVYHVAKPKVELAHERLVERREVAALLAEEQKQRQAVLAAQVRGRRDQQRLSAAQQRELRFQARLPRAA